MDAIRENVSVLTMLAEVLCLLDMIVNSFANMISTKPVDSYTKPEFTGNWMGKIYWTFLYVLIAPWAKFLIVNKLTREWTNGNWCWQTSYPREYTQWFRCKYCAYRFSMAVSISISLFTFLEEREKTLHCSLGKWDDLSSYSPIIYFYPKPQIWWLSLAPTCKITSNSKLKFTVNKRAYELLELIK